MFGMEKGIKMPEQHNAGNRRAVLLFDGVCNLCNGLVVFIIKRDAAGRIAFAALQSDTARDLLKSVGSDVKWYPDSLVLVENGRVYVESTGALRVVGMLRWPWSLLNAFMVVPRPIRDAVYRWAARNRYKWFGKREACMVPTPELKGRFL